MCGIYGSFDDHALPPGEEARARTMASLVAHRGPDHDGVFITASAILGCRRLAIVDPSAQAAQPFTSPDGKVALVCNGEIYNAPELRRRYASRYPFRSDHNDVEPVLALYLDHGEAAIAELDGMFGLAIYDGRAQRLLLARDRAGEKPLFYTRRALNGATATTLRFASETQALLVGATCAPALCMQGLAQYLQLGYTLAPHTIFEDIASLEAGQLLIADRDGIRLRRYWDVAETHTGTTVATPRETLERIESAVAAQAVADVPVGVFLSGGVDSSLLATTLVRTLPASDVHTYVARFDRAGYDESPLASEIAARLGTRHHEVDAGQASLLRALRTYADSVGEPVGDPALLPAILLSEAASHDVKVVLSGEGADELFGGYPTYLGHLWAGRTAALPATLRSGALAVAGRLPRGAGAVPLGFLLRRFLEEAALPAAERHMRWFGALGPGAFAQLGGEGRAVSAEDQALAIWERTGVNEADLTRAMRFDVTTYLAENLFTKIDRATMLSSIEARAPFVSRAVMDLALAQPAASAVHGLTTKRLLKSAAALRVPPAVVRRRKRGLSVPVSEWLCGALREEADELLSPGSLERLGLARPGRITQMLGEHRAGHADHGRKLWPVLSLQLWYERWVAGFDALRFSVDQAERARSAIVVGSSASSPKRSAPAGARSSVTR